jgi:DNA replication and repair protein RecF
VHKDDLIFSLKQMPIKTHASQGQQKTYLLSLKLAQFDFLSKNMGVKPILLLDDVLSELDSNRQHQLLNRIQGVQTMLTCTGLDEFVGKRVAMDRIFRVENGVVARE